MTGHHLSNVLPKSMSNPVVLEGHYTKLFWILTAPETAGAFAAKRTPLGSFLIAVRIFFLGSRN